MDLAMELIKGGIETLSHSLDTLWDRFCKLERAVEELREEHEALVEGVRYLRSQIIHDEPQVQQTTDEFVRIVRCKDCKWRGKYGCAVRIVDESDRTKDDDYCSWGERNEIN